MCMKDMICTAKDKMCDAKELVIDRSLDAKMAIAKKGELTPLKSISFHKSCSTPLWKIVAITMGITAGMIFIIGLTKKKNCNNCED